ncbi:MAG: type II toxin-antitoxin system RelE family toxin [Rhizobiaceae bacterium]
MASVWRIEITATAQRQIGKLDRQVARQIYRFLRERVATEENPRRMGKRLIATGSEVWRYRVGDYRILCDIRDERLVVMVVKVGHRGDVYR